MILDICDNVDVLKIMRIINIIVTIIKISVPIILIISAMLDYMKAVKDNDELAKTSKLIVTKLVAAILVFLIPTFVNIIARVMNNTSYLSCLPLGTIEGISKAYEETARTYIENAKKTYKESDYNLALNAIYKVEDEKIRKELLSELNEVEKVINIRKKIDELNKKYDYDKYLEIKKEIESLTDENIKKELLKLLDSNVGGTPLNIASSFKQYNETKYSGLSGYYLYIPKNATTNMPLIVVLPPNSLSGPSMKSIVETKSLDNLKAFIYIPIKSGSSSTEATQWNQGASTSAVSKIKDLIKDYQLDQNRISLTAFSSSGWYIYWTANEYRIFSCIAPISSGMSFDTIKSYYKDWEYLKTLPMKGYGEKGGATTESGRSCANKTVGWSAKAAMCSTFEGLGKCNDCLKCEYFTYMKESCHGEIGKDVFSIDENNNNISDIMEWMISQRK